MRLSLLMALLGSSVAGAQTAPPVPVEFHLICEGGGNALAQGGGSATIVDNRGNSATAYGTHTDIVGYADQATVDIAPGSARIRLPRRILPRIHGGLGEGWFELQGVSVRDTEIVGKVGVNFINHPSVRIDRRSGSISIDGRDGSFAGHCTAVRADAPRAF